MNKAPVRNLPRFIWDENSVSMGPDTAINSVNMAMNTLPTDTETFKRFVINGSKLMAPNSNA